MKKLSALLLLPLFSTMALQAQTSTPVSTPGNVPPPPEHDGGPRGPMGGGWGLSQTERDQLKAAKEKATQADPSLEQNISTARKALDDAQKALHDAMIKADPTVEAILAKMPARRGGPGGGKPQGAE